MSDCEKVDVRNPTSCIEPIAGFAPTDSISFCFSALRLITVTACPFFTKACVSGLLMCPNEPVTMIFI